MSAATGRRKMEDEDLTFLQTRVDKFFFSTKSQHYRFPDFSKTRWAFERYNDQDTFKENRRNYKLRGLKLSLKCYKTSSVRGLRWPSG